MTKFLSFPENFLWGCVTSSYQVEGQNINNDWYLWEKDFKVPYPCGQAVDSYHRFEEDFDLIKSLSHNAHRLSLEWSRIQPYQNQFNNQEIEHYKKVISSLKEKKIKTIVTLHHFTNPLWFYQNGCWLNPQASDYFAEYVHKVCKEFSGLIDYWITINEPLVYVYNSYIRGIWPPGEKCAKKAFAVSQNLAQAHLKAYAIIHNHCPGTKVSIAKNMRIFSPCPYYNFGQNSIPAFIRNKVFNFALLKFLTKKKSLDFIGLNYYAKDFVIFSMKDAFGKDCSSPHHKCRRNSLGWYIFPEGIFNILIKLKKLNLPIMITENGTTEKEDSLYEDCLRKHLFFVAQALSKGVNIIGYLWWSLIDNFEWDQGFAAKFGLIAVDKDLNRSIKPFAHIYKEICANNRIEYV